VLRRFRLRLSRRSIGTNCDVPPWRLASPGRGFATAWVWQDDRTTHAPVQPADASRRDASEPDRHLADAAIQCGTGRCTERISSPALWSSVTRWAGTSFHG